MAVPNTATAQPTQQQTAPVQPGQLRGRTAMSKETEQEPLAWMVYTKDGQSVYVTDNPAAIQADQRALPLYTSPPAQRTWVGLSEQELESIWYQSEAGGAMLLRFAEAIEAKLKEKNT